jgi:hypothetical protein
MVGYPLVQGKEPDSWQEVYFANALDKYKIPYIFQYVILQKVWLRGAIAIDFVLYLPFLQPVEIFGRYWHEGSMGVGDKLKLDLERRYFGRETIVIWSDEIETQEMANQYVKSHFL